MPRSGGDESSYPLIAEDEELGPTSRLVTPPRMLPQALHGTAQNPGACPFGVRSYLHLFYASPVTSDIEGHNMRCEECMQEEDKRGSRLFTRLMCKAFMWTGINVTLVGIITLVVSFMLPKRSLIIGRHENLEVVDRSAQAYNEVLDRCHLAGLTLVCLGGAVLLVALLLFSFIPARGVAPSSPHLCPLHAPPPHLTDMVSPFEFQMLDERLSHVQPSCSSHVP